MGKEHEKLPQNPHLGLAQSEISVPGLTINYSKTESGERIMDSNLGTFKDNQSIRDSLINKVPVEWFDKQFRRSFKTGERIGIFEPRIGSLVVTIALLGGLAYWEFKVRRGEDVSKISKHGQQDIKILFEYVRRAKISKSLKEHWQARKIK